MSTTMTIVWERTQLPPGAAEDIGRDEVRLGTVSDNFMAMWAEEDGSLHYTVCVSPELQHLADAIEELLTREEYGPVLSVLKLPVMEAEDGDGS